jgi:hypothetical protein
MRDDELKALLAKARPSPEFLKLTHAMLRDSPAPQITGEDLASATRYLNFLRALDSPSITTATLAIEYRIDDRTAHYATLVIGTPKRVTALKVLLDDAIYKMIGQNLSETRK